MMMGEQLIHKSVTAERRVIWRDVDCQEQFLF